MTGKDGESSDSYTENMLKNRAVTFGAQNVDKNAIIKYNQLLLFIIVSINRCYFLLHERSLK